MNPRLPQPSSIPPVALDTQPSSTLDVVFIEGFTARTVIGIHISELHEPQTLVIDVRAGVPRPAACDTDAIGDTIDYGVMRERLQRLMREHRLKLLEALAETIANILLVEFGARWVQVKVVKPRKFDDVEAVGVQIERSAADVPAEAQTVSGRHGRGASVLHLIGRGMVPDKR